VGDILRYSLTHSVHYDSCFEVKVLAVVRLRDFLEIRGLRWRLARLVMPNVVILSLRPVAESTYGMEGKA
jgi:hypothetical protein